MKTSNVLMFPSRFQTCIRDYAPTKTNGIRDQIRIMKEERVYELKTDRNKRKTTSKQCSNHTQIKATLAFPKHTINKGLRQH